MFGEIWSGGDFDNFLVSSLNGAIALVEVNDVPVLIAEDLDFDVPCASDEFFEEDFVATESVFRFALCLFEIACQLVFGFNDSHSASSTPFGGFEHDWVSHFPGEFCGFLEAYYCGRRAVENRDTDLFGDFSCSDFIS